VFRKILVAIDFSRESLHALDTAFTVCQDGGEVVAVHIVDAGAFRTLTELGVALAADLRKTTVEKATARLGRVMEQARAPSGVKVKMHVSVAIPFVGVTDYAASCGADLICIGTLGKSGFQEMVSGSFAQRVIKTSPCAVLVVKNGAHA